MRRATTFILAAGFTLLLAAGAMAWGGGYGGGWGGHMMAPGYHMYQGNGYGPGYQGQGYGPANCPGWNAYQGGNQGRGYYGPDQDQAPYQGYGRGYRQAPVTPPADNLER